MIAAEAVHRLTSRPTRVVVVTAAVGWPELGALSQVARANRESLNVEGSYQHLLTDLYVRHPSPASRPDDRLGALT